MSLNILPLGNLLMLFSLDHVNTDAGTPTQSMTSLHLSTQDQWTQMQHKWSEINNSITIPQYFHHLDSLNAFPQHTRCNK